MTAPTRQRRTAAVDVGRRRPARDGRRLRRRAGRRLAHGWTLAQAAWDDVADRLLTPRVAAGELQVIRYDQPGHGRSTWPAGPTAGSPSTSSAPTWASCSTSSLPTRSGPLGGRIDGRHDDHVPGRGAPELFEAGARRRPGVDVGR